MPRTQTGWRFSFFARSSAARTITSAPSAGALTSRSESGSKAGGEARTSSGLTAAAWAATGLARALRRFLAATWAHCSRVLPEAERYMEASSPARAWALKPSGLTNTGSRAKAWRAPGVSTFEALLCASTATTSTMPLAICM